MDEKNLASGEVVKTNETSILLESHNTQASLHFLTKEAFWQESVFSKSYHADKTIIKSC